MREIIIMWAREDDYINVLAREDDYINVLPTDDEKKPFYMNTFKHRWSKNKRNKKK